MFLQRGCKPRGAGSPFSHATLARKANDVINELNV
jgi:hypothetical protein